MAEARFSAQANYARFLQAQYGFLREVDALYGGASPGAAILCKLAGNPGFDEHFGARRRREFTGVLELMVIAYLLRRPEGPPGIDSGTPAARFNWHQPSSAAVVVALHGALLAGALYRQPPVVQAVRPEPDSARPAMLLFMPAAAPPKPLEQKEARQVSAASMPARAQPKPQQQASKPPVLPQADAEAAPPAEAPPAVAAPQAASNSAQPSASASIAAAPPSPSLPPAPQEVRSGAATWEGKVLARMERFRRYPAAARARRDQGVVYLRCRINREGQVLAAQIERSSGHPALDQAALDTLQRASPLPRIPPERPEPLDLSIPVEFQVG